MAYAGLKDDPVQSPLASCKWDDVDQSEWTTSENQPSGKGISLKREAWRITTSKMGGCGREARQLQDTNQRFAQVPSTWQSTLNRGLKHIQQFDFLWNGHLRRVGCAHGETHDMLLMDDSVILPERSRNECQNHRILFKQYSLSIQFGDSDGPGSAVCHAFEVVILSADSENSQPQLWHMAPYGTTSRPSGRATREDINSEGTIPKERQAETGITHTC
ncbi:proteasome subunit alpha type 5 [Culex quinquefasciatus]|uniref:Proteasome subunit alpha type 5 n=1 Tax=Culex quinquefasciatus TaxID=7176 RepID=B0XGW3_CULQU|nr:proteasome subunit alpha type 5 [Culex quinquefasciatus]|eukprot:XP_001868885.1 proteasome subunit alpha type 5 [Culex quinquefasciatus]